MTIRISDPKPAFCSACHNQPADSRYVDFDAAHDGGAWADANTQAYVAGSEDLHICEACMRAGLEALALRPEQARRQFIEIEKLKLLREGDHAYIRRLEAALAVRPEIDPPVRRGPGRPRKTPVGV